MEFYSCLNISLILHCTVMCGEHLNKDLDEKKYAMGKQYFKLVMFAIPIKCKAQGFDGNGEGIH